MKYTLSYPKFDVDYDSFTLKNIDSEISIEGVEQATSSIGLIHPRNLKEKDKELFTRIARFFDYPIMEFEGRTAKEAKEKIKKFRKDSSLTDLIIIGDELAFPSFRYRTKHSISYTDNYYEDIDSNGQFNLRVGRIFQSPQLLLNHISKGFSRDEGPVVIFDANPEQDNEIVHLLKSENYSIEEYANIGETKKEHLVNSSIILQLSDVFYDNVIHGTSTELVGEYGNVIFSYTDFTNLKMSNYPLIYTQACTTGNFGPLVHAILKAGGCFLGASCPTIETFQRDEEWRDIYNIFGYTIGFFEKMKSTNSISESKLAVQREYFNNLELEYQEQYHQFFDGKVRIIDDRHLRVLLQMQFFGNPASPSIRGGK